MFPQSELSELAIRKAAVLSSVRRRRTECAHAAARLAQPVVWLDRIWTIGRQIAPLVAAPLALVVVRTFFRRSSLVGSLLRWSPLILGVVRGAGAIRAGRAHRRPGVSK